MSIDHDPPAEREPGDARVTDDTDRADQAVRLCRDVKFAEEGATIGSGNSRFRIDNDTAHLRQVDDEAAVATLQPGGAVSAGLHDDLEGVVPCEADRRGDLRGCRGTDDDRRPPVVDRVPETARLVVRRIVGRDDLAARAAQLIEGTAPADRPMRRDHDRHRLRARVRHAGRRTA